VYAPRHWQLLALLWRDLLPLPIAILPDPSLHLCAISLAL